MKSNYGELYIIKNSINNNVYIGITSDGIKNRWRRHLLSSKTSNTKLYKVMRDVGIRNFYIEKLGQFDIKELPEKEVEYIEKYDSYKNGYNSNCGGILGLKLFIDETELIDDYISGMTYTKLAIKYKCSESKICSVLNKNLKENINREVNKETHNKSKIIVMYDLRFNPIGQFKSMRLAHEYVCKQENKDISKFNFYDRVGIACKNGNIAYSHRWQLFEDLIISSKSNIIFKTSFDKQAYLNGGEIKYEGKLAVCENETVNKTKSYVDSHGENTNICPDCGGYKVKLASTCIDCKNKKQKKFSENQIEELNQLTSKYSLEEVGRQLGVTGKAIAKRCKSYGIKINKNNRINMENKIIVKIAFGIEVGRFNNFKDAGQSIIDEGLSTASTSSIGYRIREAIINNKKTFGYDWKLIETRG